MYMYLSKYLLFTSMEGMDILHFMDLSERQTKILKLLAGSGVWVDNHSLALAIENTGRETLRKEISALEELGLLIRAHGKTRIRRENLTREILKVIGLLSKTDRQEEILGILEKTHSVRIASLAEIFHVAEATIRNDVAELLPSDRIKWQYGKVHYLPKLRTPGMDILSPDFIYPDHVQHVADRASQFITFGDSIFLDSSSYSLCVLGHIDAAMELVIFTDSFRIPMLAAQRNMKADIRILGGSVDLAALTTAGACPALETVDKAFAEIGSTKEGELRHRDGHACRILETLLPGSCSFFFYLPPEATFSATQGDLTEVTTEVTTEAATQTAAPRIGIQAERIGEIILSEPSSALATCAREGIPTSIARDSHVVMNPLGEVRRIGVATLDASHEFSQRFINNLQLHIRALPDYRFFIADNRMDSDTTLANLDLFVREKADIIIEYQHEHKLGRIISEKMCRAGIPILAIDIAIPGAYYFGANNYEAGRIAGTELARIALARWQGTQGTQGIPVNLVIITDKGAGESAENRVAGTIDAFRELVQIPDRRITILNSENDVLSAEKVVLDQLFVPEGSACAISCVNANLAMGTIRAVQQKNLRNTVIAAQNDTLELMKELKDPSSRLAGVVAYHPESYSDRILKLASMLLAGKPVAPATYVDHTWIPSTAS